MLALVILHNKRRRNAQKMRCASQATYRTEPDFWRRLQKSGWLVVDALHQYKDMQWPGPKEAHDSKEHWSVTRSSSTQNNSAPCWSLSHAVLLGCKHRKAIIRQLWGLFDDNWQTCYVRKYQQRTKHGGTEDILISIGMSGCRQLQSPHRWWPEPQLWQLPSSARLSTTSSSSFC